MSIFTSFAALLSGTRRARAWESVTPEDAHRRLGDLQIVDVRQPDEFRGPIGHVRGAQLCPLNQLAARLDTLAKDKPTLVVCRSGIRSAIGCQVLVDHGFERVFNLHGGMTGWRALHLPVAADDEEAGSC
jgi:sulfur dioxygenase